MPGVTISYKNVQTGVTGTVLTADLGTYIIPSVPVGTYDVEASLGGFRTEVQRGVTVTVGATVAVNFSLTVGGLAETVEVNATPPQVNTTDATVGGLVGESTIRELPLNGRDWLQLASFAGWRDWRSRATAGFLKGPTPALHSATEYRSLSAAAARRTTCSLSMT